jgi:hypothetical protein
MEGRKEMEENESLGRPSTSKPKKMLRKSVKLFGKKRRLSIRMIAEMVNMDKERVRQILHDRLIMKKVCAKMVPKNVTQEQKGNRKNICSDIMERITEQLDMLENVIICDVTRIFQYDPETKRQSMHWKTPTSPRMKKARMSNLKVKAMIVFFDIRGVIVIEWVPKGQMVNRKYYLEVLTKL